MFKDVNKVLKCTFVGNVIGIHGIQRSAVTDFSYVNITRDDLTLFEDIPKSLLVFHFEMVGGMYWFRFFKLMRGLLFPSFFFSRNRFLTNWLFAETFFIWTFSIATFFKRFPVSSAATDFSFRLRWISLGNCWCRLRKKRTLIFLDNFLKIHVFTKSFSLPAIWTFGSWPDENNIFTSLWAYYDFSGGIRVGISLKKVVFICIFTIVLVMLVEVPALSLTVVFVRTLVKASTLVKAILNPIGLVMIMDLQIDE